MIYKTKKREKILRQDCEDLLNPIVIGTIVTGRKRVYQNIRPALSENKTVRFLLVPGK
jgi:DNA mismatch repair protein MutH